MTKDTEGDYIIFYFDPSSRNIVNSSHNIKLNIFDICDFLEYLYYENKDKKNFWYFGITDRSGVTVQFVSCEDGSVRIDRPDPARKGSMVKNADIEECLDVIYQAGSSLAELEIPGMVFKYWK